MFRIKSTITALALALAVGIAPAAEAAPHGHQTKTAHVAKKGKKSVRATASAMACRQASYRC